MKMKKIVQNDNNFAIAYYRFSSHSQNEASIDQQREAARRYAKDHGYKIIAEYADRGISGKTDKRPGYQRMLSEVAKLKPAVLILWKVDRLGRDIVELATQKRYLRNNGCNPVYITEVTREDDSANAKLIETIQDAMAELYSNQLSENVCRGIEHVAKNGLYNGVKMLGYMRGEDGRFAIDRNTEPIVKRIFLDYTNGIGMKKIVNSLNSEGLITSRGRKFTINSIRGILHNRAYIGVYDYAGHVHYDAIPPIISSELFNKAQDMMSKNKRMSGQKARGLDSYGAPRYWLTGKLFCGNCLKGMQGMNGKSKPGVKYYYYACPRNRKHKCDRSAVRKEVIEDIVLNVLSEFLRNYEMRASLAVDLAAYYEEHYADNKYLESLKAERCNVQGSINNLIKSLEKGIFSGNVQKRLSELEERAKCLDEIIVVEETRKQINEDSNSITAYFEKYTNANLADKAVRDEVLSYFIEKIYVFDDRIIIKFSGAGIEQEFIVEQEDDGVFRMYGDEFDHLMFCSAREKDP